MPRPTSLSIARLQTAPRNRPDLRFAAAQARRPAGAFALDQSFQALADQRRALGQTGDVPRLKAADLVIFDPATVANGDKEWANDLPGGGRRFVTRSTGIRATIVNGKVLFENGAYRSDTLAGRMLRSYDD